MNTAPLNGKRCHSLEELTQIIEQFRVQGKRIVLTSGTFDILHIGHGRYLSRARGLGDVLVVGIDSDAKVKARKGPHRPVVGEDERAEMVAYLASVDLLYLKQLEDPRWALIKAVRPDVLVVSKRSDYSEDEIVQLAEYCGTVTVLESQAETSTTGRIRSLLISQVAPLGERLRELRQHVNAMTEEFEEFVGGQ